MQWLQRDGAAVARVPVALTPPAGEAVSRTEMAKRAASRPITMNPRDRDRAKPTSGGWANWLLASASCSALMPMPWSDTEMR